MNNNISKKIKSSKQNNKSKQLFENRPSGGESTPLITNAIVKISIYEVLGTPGDTHRAIAHGWGFGGG